MENEPFLLIPFSRHLSLQTDYKVLRGSYYIYLHTYIYTYTIPSMPVKTAVDRRGPEHASKCYCNASSNSELAKNPSPNPLPRPGKSLFAPNNIILRLTLAWHFHVSVPCPFIPEKQDFPSGRLQFHQSVRITRN